LLALASCFVLSALLRAGDVIAALPASGGDDGFGNPLPTPAQEEITSAAQSPAEAAGKSMTLIAELRAQRERLNERETALRNREQMLKTIEERLNTRLEEIRSARERLKDTAALVDDAAGKDVRRLAQMYQQMKPKQAGQIFNEMAPSFAAGFIAEMKPEAAALIMANMDAEKAYAVSLLIAGRNIKSGQN
jgi:flagellar motility protein MotE (MotC chaperone)